MYTVLSVPQIDILSNSNEGQFYMKTSTFLYKPRFFEEKAWKKNLITCGIDEVGRGSLAGPLVVAAAITPQNCKYVLKDSKLLSYKQLLEAYDWINQHCIYSTATMNWKEIDRINIYQATLKTMNKAYIQLISDPRVDFRRIKYLLTDAMPISPDKSCIHENMEIFHFPKGESISPSIAAASIVAKVTRDRVMVKMSQYFPAFKLEQNKGYGSKYHYEHIIKNGPSIIHRKSFLKKLEGEKNESLF